MDINLWKVSLTSAMKELWTTVAGFIPSLVGAILIFITGYLVAKILQKITTSILKKIGFDRIGEKVGIQENLEKVRLYGTPSTMMGRIVFWLFMLIFVVSAAESLGLSTVSEAVFSLVFYLPKVIGAAIIFVVGLFVANVASGMVRKGSDRMGGEYSKVLGSLTYGLLALVVAVLAIGQLELEILLLSRLVQITFLTIGGALVLMVGLGARDLAKNVISGIYAREIFKVGDQLIIGEEGGQLEMVGAVNTKLKRENGEYIFVPNTNLIGGLVKSKPKG